MRKMTGCIVVFCLGALCLCAADSWQSKPFTEWNEKEVQKILTNSAWARSISVSMDVPLTPGGRGDRLGVDESPRPGGSGQEPGAGIAGGSRGEGDARGGSQVLPSMVLTIRWQSALPVKQALVRRKYGSEAGTSPEAKKFLEENPGYLISLAGLPPTTAAANTPQGKAAIKEQTTLSVKGRGAVQPAEIVVGPPRKQMEVFFVFPKTTAFTLDDKEVEFATQLGPIKVKYKFHLKDMVLNGNLEL
jgi:hypothetical protein